MTKKKEYKYNINGVMSENGFPAPRLVLLCNDYNISIFSRSGSYNGDTADSVVK